MRLQLTSVPCLLVLFVAGAGTAYAQDKKEPIRPTDVIQLFNGKDLANFHVWLSDTKGEDPKKIFAVHDGLLHVSGDGLGYLSTNDEYRDYHLVAEFKWGEKTWGNRQDKARDSGILVHAVGPDGSAGAWMASIEYQVIEGGVGDFILIGGKYADGATVPMKLACETTKDRDGENVWKKGGARETFTRGRINWYGRDVDWKDALGFRGRDDVESPLGEWTKCEVISDGGHIQAYVNGKLVNEGFDAFPSAGRILIQTELAEVYFRKFELHPLKKK
ncbi:MAG: DUF1080 domain-containing protein [Planctomycetia bacterium]|nr:DUF1080 domain-containing protein [Planctomycetia bacterium]